MATTRKRTLIREGEEVDKQELPITATYDPRIERLLRQWEEAREATSSKRTARFLSRRAPFAYD